MKISLSLSLSKEDVSIDYTWDTNPKQKVETGQGMIASKVRPFDWTGDRQTRPYDYLATLRARQTMRQHRPSRRD